MTAEELINLALDADKIEDFQTVFNYYKQAAELKNPSAMAMLAGMYELGIGVESDIHEALKWYVDAANAGEEHAQQRLETFFKDWGNLKKLFLEIPKFLLKKNGAFCLKIF